MGQFLVDRTWRVSEMLGTIGHAAGATRLVARVCCGLVTEGDPPVASTFPNRRLTRYAEAFFTLKSRLTCPLSNGGLAVR